MRVWTIALWNDNIMKVWTITLWEYELSYYESMNCHIMKLSHYKSMNLTLFKLNGYKRGYVLRYDLNLALTWWDTEGNHFIKYLKLVHIAQDIIVDFATCVHAILSDRTNLIRINMHVSNWPIKQHNWHTTLWLYLFSKVSQLHGAGY